MIDGTYAEERYLNEAGKIDYRSLKPVLFEFPIYEYMKIGEAPGKCLSFKKIQMRKEDALCREDHRN